MEVRLLIGIDDTDGPGSRGTGFLSRQLGEFIEANGLGRLRAVSRHYLLADDGRGLPEDNSAVCLEITSPDRDAVTRFCRNFLPDEASHDASPGLCVVSWDQAPQHLIRWAAMAKKELIGQEAARAFARKHAIFLEGWRQGSGLVGAMAAAGLRRSGNDGRFIWLARLRELSGHYTAEDLMALTAIDRILDIQGSPLDPNEVIEVGDWVRPLNKDQQIIMVVERGHGKDAWVPASREYIRRVSS